MPVVINAEWIGGCVLGVEYFNEDEDTPFCLFIHLLFVRISIYLNATRGPDDHNDLGDVL